MNLETMSSQTAKRFYFVSFLIMYVCVSKQAYTCIALSAEARKDTESLGRRITAVVTHPRWLLTWNNTGII